MSDQQPRRQAAVETGAAAVFGEEVFVGVGRSAPDVSRGRGGEARQLVLVARVDRLRVDITEKHLGKRFHVRRAVLGRGSAGGTPTAVSHEPPSADALGLPGEVVEIGESEEVAHLVDEGADAHDALGGALEAAHGAGGGVGAQVFAIARLDSGEGPLARPEGGRGVARMRLRVTGVNHDQHVHPPVVIPVALSEIEARVVGRSDRVCGHDAGAAFAGNLVGVVAVVGLVVRQPHPVAYNKRDVGAPVGNLSVIIARRTCGAVDGVAGRVA